MEITDINTGAFELTQQLLFDIKQAAEEQSREHIQQLLDLAQPADVRDVLYELELELAMYVLKSLDTDFAAHIFIEMDESTRQEYIQMLSFQEIATFLDELDSDDGADLLAHLDNTDKSEILSIMNNDEKAGYLLDLINYDADEAGGLMAKELIKANINWSVQQCIEEIRKQAERVEKFYAIYVVDDHEKLLGKVSLKKIIVAANKTPIKELFDEDIMYVDANTPQREVAELMKKYDMETIPVVNLRGKLIGRITIDDVVDVISEIAEEERSMMAGISSGVEEDDGVWILSKARLPWLLIGMIGGLLGAHFLGFFEQDIALVPAMAFFIPLITATGGNVGIQSSSLVVQRLANPSAFETTLTRRLVKVLMVALLNGLVLSGMVFLSIMVFKQDMQMGVIVSVALFSVVILASLMGTFTPIFLHKININPALASGPFITTANDLIGLAVYFGVARMLYGF